MTGFIIIVQLLIIFSIVVEISFTSDDVRVNENNGTVYVCIEKNLQTDRDIFLDITASVLPNEADCM